MAETTIEWTHYTFNPVRGCRKISDGCKHCYASIMSKRNPGVLGEWGPNAPRVHAAESYWRGPIKWNRAAEAAGERRRVFCASLADIFEGEPLEGGKEGGMGPRADYLPALERLFALIRATPHLDWLLLTKRPWNMEAYVALELNHDWPENAWAGTSVENQAAADERIPHLLRVPAPVRFLSMEPLLGPVDLDMVHASCGDPLNPTYCPGHFQPLRGHFAAATGVPEEDHRNSMPMDERIHWLIIGGESGPKARPMHPEWARSLIRQGQEAGAAVHFKQHGEHAPLDDADCWEVPAGWDDVALEEKAFTAHGARFAKVGKKAAGRVIDGRTWDEIPGVTRV